MTNSNPPVRKDLVLVGGGHSHLEVLRRFGRTPLPSVHLTLISRDTFTPYSGMLPGFIAGHYSFEDCHIDLRKLCQFAGACFSCDEVNGFDLTQRLVYRKNGSPMHYDVLSVDIGSTPRMADVPGLAGNVVPVKPIGGFILHWERIVERVLGAKDGGRFGVVGTGAGGIEVLLSAQYRLRELLAAQGRTDNHLEYYLFGQASEILRGYNARTRCAFERVLRDRQIRVLLNSPIASASPGRLRRANGEEYELDEILWVTNAGAAPWLEKSGLQTDPQGFIKVKKTLESVSHPGVFAAGDIASLIEHPLPKAGVFAVRQGPLLARNLKARLLGRSLRLFNPQQKYLSLITTGNKYAVASRGGWTFEGRLVWRWKDWIDRRFMGKYKELPPRSGGQLRDSCGD
jgi:selenide,water dikinase